MEAVESYDWAGVTNEELDWVWDEVEPLLAKALKRSGMDRCYDPKDIKLACLEEEMQCWVIFSREGVAAVVITSILVYPKIKVLAIPFLGAKEHTMPDWLHFYPLFEAFAKSKGCKLIKGWGRKGWEKVFKPEYSRIEFEIEVRSDENLH
jgi:hypothetical protein